jgi:hypothetical protein
MGFTTNVPGKNNNTYSAAPDAQSMRLGLARKLFATAMAAESRATVETVVRALGLTDVGGSEPSCVSVENVVYAEDTAMLGPRRDDFKKCDGLTHGLWVCSARQGVPSIIIAGGDSCKWRVDFEFVSSKGVMREFIRQGALQPSVQVPTVTLFTPATDPNTRVVGFSAADPFEMYGALLVLHNSNLTRSWNIDNCRLRWNDHSFGAQTVQAGVTVLSGSINRGPDATPITWRMGSGLAQGGTTYIFVFPGFQSAVQADDVKLIYSSANSVAPPAGSILTGAQALGLSVTIPNAGWWTDGTITALPLVRGAAGIEVFGAAAGLDLQSAERDL